LELLLATGNPNKVEELAALLDGQDLRLRTTSEFPDEPDIVEDGDTYEANAVIKAREWARRAGMPTLADDSGLEVDALDGRPGIHSNRYASDNDRRIAGILRELEGVETARRSARFVCAMALAWPDGRVDMRRGVCEGRIGFEPAGEGGFGYDPIFLLPDRGLTMAQIDAGEKNRISHRARAVRAILPLLREATRPAGEDKP
jgi:XTP/dITP diphosphohydrolase